MIYDPADTNIAIDDDGTMMIRVIAHDTGPGADPSPMVQFVPMPRAFQFRRPPEW